MGDQSDRDRQPSDRYLHRLAERVIDKLSVAEDDEPTRTTWPVTVTRREVRWAIIDAAAELRTENGGRV